MPIAAIVAMKPGPDQSVLVAEQRLAGAIIGAAAAALFLLTIDTKDGLHVVVIVFATIALSIRGGNYALYCAAIACFVLVAMDIPHPSDLADEGRRVLFTFLGVGIAVVVTLIANELQKRHAPATPATTCSPAASGPASSGVIPERWRTRAARSSTAFSRAERASNRLRSAAVLEYTVKALDESTWPAFAALVERNNGVFGGCWCMGFHEDNKGTVPPKRERKLARVRAGTAHAALVFDGEDCLGWCQFGAPDEVPRIKNRAAYEKGVTALPDWRTACHFVGKGHRRQGVASAALAGALDLIAGLGGGTVEGYPEDAGSVPAGFLFHGALSTYERLGFVRDRQIGKHRWVVTKVVEPKL